MPIGPKQKERERKKQRFLSLLSSYVKTIHHNILDVKKKINFISEDLHAKSKEENKETTVFFLFFLCRFNRLFYYLSKKKLHI